MKSNRRKFLLSSLVSVASGLALANCSGGTPDKPSNSANVHKKIYKYYYVYLNKYNNLFKYAKCS